MNSLDRSIASNIIGSGYLKFRSGSGHVWWGTRTISAQGTVSIPINTANFLPSLSVVSAAIWWPEDRLAAHNHLSMYMVSPSNSWSGTFYADSVWQHLGWHTTDNGTWSLKVVNNSNNQQTFYYTFRAYQ